MIFPKTLDGVLSIYSNVHFSFTVRNKRNYIIFARLTGYLKFFLGTLKLLFCSFFFTFICFNKYCTTMIQLIDMYTSDMSCAIFRTSNV